jgi:hypothetical protein
MKQESSGIAPFAVLAETPAARMTPGAGAEPCAGGDEDGLFFSPIGRSIHNNKNESARRR